MDCASGHSPMMWSGLSSAFEHVFAGATGRVVGRPVGLVFTLLGAGRVLVVAGRGLGDVSERCGSVDRHNDVRELRSQFWDAQEGAPE